MTSDEMVETQWERNETRIKWAHRARLDTPPRAEPEWLARELAYWCVLGDPRFAYHIVLRLPLGLEYAVSSPAPGTRVVRLLYDWQEDIGPYTHLTPAQLSNTVALRLGTKEGERLRASVRYARERGSR